MREICTSGSMSREWKRTVWQAPQARRTTPRHFLTLPLATSKSKSSGAVPVRVTPMPSVKHPHGGSDCQAVQQD